MIYTVTLNPAIDYIIKLDEFSEGRLNLVKSSSKLPGGKGINVSRVLKNFKQENIALGFLGGFTGAFIRKELDLLEIKNDFIEIKEDTRINIKMRAAQIETEINGNSPFIDSVDFKNLKNKLERVKKGDVLVLSGGIPSFLSANTYNELVNSLKAGVKVILDTSGKALKDSLKLSPFLIKPNNFELEELFNVKLKDFNEIIFYAKKILTLGALNVIVSLGSEGALFVNENHVFKANPLKGDVKNTTGAGDSMVAGFIFKFLQTGDFRESFKFSVASGCATAFSNNLCELREVESIFSSITVEEI